MNELVKWLRAQLDEDERIARARRGVFPSPGVDDDGAVWLHVRPGGNAVIVRYGDPVAGYDDMAKLRDWADAEHGWTQERVLREIDAKRRIIELHEPYDLDARDRSGSMIGCAECVHDDKTYPCTTLRLLALPYAGRPGYREEWRP